MKTIPTTLLAAAGLMLAIAADAQVNIYIAGAVSLKDVTYYTLKNNMYGGGFALQNLDNSTKPTSANVYTMSGTMTNLFGSQTVNVYVNWNGSGSAIQSLTGNGACNFYSSATQGVTNLVAADVNVGFAVVFQSDYSYPTPVLTDSTYGVTPTVFARSIACPSSLTNLTSQTLRYIEANGTAPLSLFTGNAGDSATNIYFIMRDIGAAHRVISTKEAGFTGSAIAYYYTNSAWLLDTNGGRTTWPLIDKMLTNNYGPCITFLPPTEAGNIPSTNILSFNGVYPFNGSFNTVSNDYSPTINGQYTCWGFEHIMTTPTAGANITTFVTAFKTALSSNLLAGSPYSIPLSKMAVTRSSTGGLVTPR